MKLFSLIFVLDMIASAWAQVDVSAITESLDHMWLLVCGALVMFMQAGFAILEAGSIRSKNAETVLLKNLIDVCLGTVMWYVFGYGIAYGVGENSNRFVGTRNFLGGSFLTTDADSVITGTDHFKDWFFQWAFCATAATIVAGGVAERIQFGSYIIYSAVMSGFIYPFVVYWTWSGFGWLSIGNGEPESGYSDFAGSGIVHLTGGVGALVGAVALGPREGRWKDDTGEFKPHNMGMVVLGTFILWFGWYGFNCGSTLAFSTVATVMQAGLVAMNTTIAASAGGLTVFVLRLRGNSLDLAGMCNGILSGLVAVCAGVGYMEPAFAFVTGILGGLGYEAGSVLMKALKVDDPLDAFAVHGCGGVVGVLVRPIFDRTGFKGNMFGWHILALLVIALWTAAISALVFVPLRLVDRLRVSKEEEKAGTDSHLSHRAESPIKMSQIVPSSGSVAPERSSPVCSGGGAAVALNSPNGYNEDFLCSMSVSIFNEDTMAYYVGGDVFTRFKQSLMTGEPTGVEDQKVIAAAMFEWARKQGATDFAHWFFPCRGGAGAVGGSLGALKRDLFADILHSAKSANKPFMAMFPHERLFQGETDGSSFPNGGLRVTHSAAAFTVWDRSSPPFIIDNVLRIPCSFLTHYGHCIDEKTPLLRSADALQREGLRLLKNIKIGTEAKAMHSYLGWEQEFFVVAAEHFKARPDLVNCGRTLIGSLPPRNQQAELNYFGPVPVRVDTLMHRVQGIMLKVGCAMTVRHNEVAPGQHEMCPIYTTAPLSADFNVLFMEVMNQEAAKLGLQVLFHEKPFAGINGNGKHSNWSIGTDTGLNFFCPGKTDNERALFVSAVACLAHGLNRHNELVRCAVAHAGNDHRLGAQEAPPAIISLYPGTTFEAHVDHILQGGQLHLYKAEKGKQVTGCRASMAVEANIEDRNRTAPFPFCGNRFEFRAVGSSQNCAFPVMICNTVMASGMAHLSELIENGMSHRDAVAQMFRDNKKVIFTGNGYAANWLEEAEKRGLPNLDTTPKAIAAFNSAKNKAALSSMRVFTDQETDARGNIMYENYITTLTIEAETLIMMVETGIIPACAQDLSKYSSAPQLAGDRQSVYESIKAQTDRLKAMLDTKPEGATLAEEAAYLCEQVKPQMGRVRNFVDTAEGLLEKGLYPYPSYATLLYSHHF
mmetsp:Transcript_47050/g.131160  ORF Transcript_47050/g.131160 Transcript_47050/m.131160 type:complete len:1165 (+) Transcript_47050:86-3580(+)|eukprot:CAMPEP_0117469714 /NCGR_PEP_ID=MMETSP0784-20121206/6841_1 /TAXON_ID=39447 /ORGANISM="" /LENGTH=1164 /DNA_ID=CAMNT_0005263777 /DNA_START=85 /DNA_END=3579 /DNA_ORIENTATION=+